MKDWFERNIEWFNPGMLILVILVVLIILAVILSGCSNTEATYNKDGTVTVRRQRLLMTEDIDSFSYDARDGSFTLEGYRSDMTRMIDLVDRLTKKDKEKGVKP